MAKRSEHKYVAGQVRTVMLEAGFPDEMKEANAWKGYTHDHNHNVLDAAALEANKERSNDIIQELFQRFIKADAPGKDDYEAVRRAAGILNNAMGLTQFSIIDGQYIMLPAEEEVAVNNLRDLLNTKRDHDFNVDSNKLQIENKKLARSLGGPIPADLELAFQGALFRDSKGATKFDLTQIEINKDNSVWLARFLENNIEGLSSVGFKYSNIYDIDNILQTLADHPENNGIQIDLKDEYVSEMRVKTVTKLLQVNPHLVVYWPGMDNFKSDTDQKTDAACQVLKQLNAENYGDMPKDAADTIANVNREYEVAHPTVSPPTASTSLPPLQLIPEKWWEKLAAQAKDRTIKMSQATKDLFSRNNNETFEQKLQKTIFVDKVTGAKKIDLSPLIIGEDQGKDVAQFIGANIADLAFLKVDTSSDKAVWDIFDALVKDPTKKGIELRLDGLLLDKDLVENLTRRLSHYPHLAIYTDWRQKVIKNDNEELFDVCDELEDLSNTHWNNFSTIQQNNINAAKATNKRNKTETKFGKFIDDLKAAAERKIKIGPAAKDWLAKRAEAFKEFKEQVEDNWKNHNSRTERRVLRSLMGTAAVATLALTTLIVAHNYPSNKKDHKNNNNNRKTEQVATDTSGKQNASEPASETTPASETQPTSVTETAGLDTAKTGEVVDKKSTPEPGVMRRKSDQAKDKVNKNDDKPTTISRSTVKHDQGVTDHQVFHTAFVRAHKAITTAAAHHKPVNIITTDKHGKKIAVLTREALKKLIIQNGGKVRKDYDILSKTKKGQEKLDRLLIENLRKAGQNYSGKKDIKKVTLDDVAKAMNLEQESGQTVYEEIIQPDVKPVAQQVTPVIQAKVDTVAKPTPVASATIVVQSASTVMADSASLASTHIKTTQNDSTFSTVHLNQNNTLQAGNTVDTLNNKQAKVKTEVGSDEIYFNILDVKNVSDLNQAHLMHGLVDSYKHDKKNKHSMYFVDETDGAAKQIQALDDAMIKQINDGTGKFMTTSADRMVTTTTKKGIHNIQVNPQIKDPAIIISRMQPEADRFVQELKEAGHQTVIFHGVCGPELVTAFANAVIKQKGAIKLDVASLDKQIAMRALDPTTQNIFRQIKADYIAIDQKITETHPKTDYDMKRIIAEVTGQSEPKLNQRLPYGSPNPR